MFYFQNNRQQLATSTSCLYVYCVYPKYTMKTVFSIQDVGISIVWAAFKILWYWCLLF